MTIVSFLLCLATAGLWVRSYWRFESLNHFSADPDGADATEFDLQSSYGELGALLERYGDESLPRIVGWRYLTGDDPQGDTVKCWAARSLSPRNVSFLGFGYFDQPPSQFSVQAVYFPHWFLALVFAILPATRLRSILGERRRNRVGLCPHFGYDLRATPARCPECGHVSSNLASSQ